MDSRHDGLIAFICGDLLVTICSWLHFDLTSDIYPLLGKISLTIILGIFGGASGLLGKDLYAYVKKRLR